MRFALALIGCSMLAVPASPALAVPSANEIVDRVLDSDSWGLGDAEVKARAVVRDKSGHERELEFEARSARYDPPLTKSLVRFTAPADLSGVGFLQIQKKSGDDERWLYLPDLGRSRRIAGKTRDNAFMQTDFSYADLDRRDLRQARTKRTGEEILDGQPCWIVEIIPIAKDAVYARMVLWARQDNYVPLRLEMFADSGVLLKTLETKELKRIEGQWFATRSLMTDHRLRRTTELTLKEIHPKRSYPRDQFTVRQLEKF